MVTIYKCKNIKFFDQFNIIKKIYNHRMEIILSLFHFILIRFTANVKYTQIKNLKITAVSLKKKSTL